MWPQNEIIKIVLNISLILPFFSTDIHANPLARFSVRGISRGPKALTSIDQIDRALRLSEIRMRHNPVLTKFTTIDKSMVRVSSSINRSVVHDMTYIRTGRGIADLIQDRTYPEWSLKEVFETRGSLLDVATGRGKFVTDFRRLGIEAHGLDVALPDELLNLPYFRNADAAAMPYASETFDFVFSSYGPFYYALPGGPGQLTSNPLVQSEYLGRIMHEMARVTKPGGRIRIAPILNVEHLGIVEMAVNRDPRLHINLVTKGLGLRSKTPALQMVEMRRY